MKKRVAGRLRLKTKAEENANFFDYCRYRAFEHKLVELCTSSLSVETKQGVVDLAKKEETNDQDFQVVWDSMHF